MDRHHSRTVLHVISSLGRLGGGAERQLLLYFQHRTGLRWRHLVAYRKHYELLREGIEQAGVDAIWLGPGGFLRQLIRFMRLARAESAELIHTHLAEANLLGRTAGRLLRIPVVTTVTNTLEAEGRAEAGDYALWKYRISLALEALTGRWGTDRFVAISRAVKESAERTLGIPESRIDVVYRAVRGEPTDGARRPTASPVLITTGRLVRHKGQDLLLRMFVLVLRQWPNATLQIVGDGKSRKDLERLAADLGIAASVRFLGLRSDVNQLLEQSDLYVYASWFEGFSNAFAEAIARGLPVVAVDLPVFREIAPSSSVLLVERSDRVFADAVLRMLEDLQAFQEAARRESATFRDRFSIQRYIEGIEAVYEHMAAGVHAHAENSG